MSQAPVEGGPGLTFPADVDAWRDAASKVTGAWSDAMAHTDLRYLRIHDAVPGRKALAARWGWSEHQVRTFLAWERTHG